MALQVQDLLKSLDQMLEKAIKSKKDLMIIIKSIKKSISQLESLDADIKEIPEILKDLFPLYYMIPGELTLDTKIEDCKISPRIKRILQNHQILTIKDLISYNPHQLRIFKNFGYKALEEIQEFLRIHQLSLKDLL